MKRVEARDVIEASRLLARQSGDEMVKSLLASGLLPSNELLKQRGDLVMDCFNTGAAVMLKLLMGDRSPEPWSDEYDHEARLRELLALYQESLEGGAK